MRVVLSVGNFPGHPTGYGGQAMYITRALRRLGHEVVVIPWSVTCPHPLYQYRLVPFHTSVAIANYRHGVRGDELRLEDEDLELLASKTTTMFNPYNRWPQRVSRAVLNKMLAIAKAELFIAFQDVFIFEEGPSRVPSLVWMPIHFQPVEHKTLVVLDSFDGIVAMSRYGEDTLENVLGEDFCGKQTAKQFWYVPHGCDETVFKPLGPFQHRLQLRKFRHEWGWPQDAHVTLMVASNTEGSNRKAWEIQIQGWVRFARHCDRIGRKCYLHIHSDAEGVIDLARVLEIFGELPNRNVDYANAFDHHSRTRLRGNHAVYGVRGPRVTITPPARLSKLSIADLAQMYRSADVLLAASSSEGFGVPIMEAQMCGTPVVTTRTTAMPEATLFGVSVPVAHWMMRSDFNAGWFVPSVEGIARGLQTVMEWSDRPSAWTPEFTEHEFRFRKVHSELLRRYAGESIVKGWTNVITDVTNRISKFGSLSKHHTFRTLQLQASRRMTEIEEALGEADTRLKALRNLVMKCHTNQEELLAEDKLVSSVQRPHLWRYDQTLA